MPKDDLQVMRELMESHQEGFALERHFYTSQAVYEHDIQRVWNRNWIWVGHVSQIAEPGNYFLFDYGPESVIVVRDREGEVRAHMNVCRHRGSRVCLEKQGTARVFSCPYHAWTFGLDGRLRGGRAMGADFDPSEYGLFPVQVQIFQGLIFICADENPPPLEESLARLAPLSAPMQLENLKLAHEASYPVPANWKLALENYLECYHCAPSHQDYSRSHSLKDPADVEKYGADLRDRSASAGLPAGELDLTGANALALGTDVYWRRYPLFPGYQTGSKDGAPLAPPLGQLTGHDGGATDLAIGTLNYFLIYADHLVGYRFIPRSLQETDIQIAWYVRGDAEEGRDYSKEALTWLWHVTSLDDERIIRHNQEGVNSHRFVPGPLSEMEWSLPGFYRSYFSMI